MDKELRLTSKLRSPVTVVCILTLLFVLVACPSGSSNKNTEPVASLSVTPDSGQAPLEVVFSWDVSDPDEDSLTCMLDIDNDGSSNYTIENCSSDETQEHTYERQGTYEAVLTVNDDEGASVMSSLVAVTVEEPEVFDPAPDRNTPGEYGCEGCPDSSLSTDDIEIDSDTTLSLSGMVEGAQGNGVFYLSSSDGEAVGGTIPTQSSGDFSFTTPLFCGEQLLKCVWSNEAGSYTLINRVISDNCTDADIRTTLTWDDLGRDFELHLIKEGGRINDNATDCTWTSCVDGSPDWGVEGDTSDDPSKDVDNTGAYGPENIFLSKPEDGTYTVMVEHWGSGDPNADGEVIFNVAGRTVTSRIENLAPQHVWTAGTVTWPSGEINISQEIFDCTEDWSRGCQADIP